MGASPSASAAAVPAPADPDGPVAALVRESLAKRAPGVHLDRDDDLRERGMASLDMVNLMLAVEEAFDLMIPGANMTPANFRTIRTIEALVAALQAA